MKEMYSFGLVGTLTLALGLANASAATPSNGAGDIGSGGIGSMNCTLYDATSKSVDLTPIPNNSDRTKASLGRYTATVFASHRDGVSRISIKLVDRISSLSVSSQGKLDTTSGKPQLAADLEQPTVTLENAAGSIYAAVICKIR